MLLVIMRLTRAAVKPVEYESICEAQARPGVHHQALGKRIQRHNGGVAIL